MNKQTSLFFSKLSKEKFLREGCKSDLLDVRINIRSMHETIGDIDSKLVNIDEETDALLNDLLAQFKPILMCKLIQPPILFTNTGN